MLIERFCRQSGLTRSQVDNYAATASKRYKTFPILKRDGTERLISQPSREIKALQRWLSRVVLRRFPVHDAATAYRKGGGIRENAERHISSNFTLRVDFQDFFHSFSSNDVSHFLLTEGAENGIDLTEEDIQFIVSIVCRYDKITIGAPSSPMLTNAMMFRFDEDIDRWARSVGVVYSRYADDLFFSARQPEVVSGALKTVRAVAKAHRYGSLRVNEAKTAFLTRKARRVITGLVVTPDRKISIGRDRKRSVRSLVHLHRHENLDAEQRAYLRGMLAFANDVEPNFRKSLCEKFGEELILEIESGGGE